MTCGQTHKERRDALLARYGPCERVDGGVVLRLTGHRAEIHPHDVAAFLHQSREAAEAYAASNREHYGHPTLAIIPCDAGVIDLIDLRPALLRFGTQPTDPGLPDGGHRRSGEVVK